ncbi:MAG: MFS transporter, partial [Edaphocola sp.]
YSMGVQTVMLAAAEFGKKEIHKTVNGISRPLGDTELVTTILLIQLVAIGGALLMARLSKSWGNISVLILTVIVWICICAAAFFTRTEMQFYGLAVAVGLVMGGIQSMSRSTYAKLMPPTEDTASFFSFYDVTEKMAIVVGMFSFGFIEHITGNMRNAIFALAIFFLAGLVALLFAKGVAKQQVLHI